jgi:hypothetical protein
MKKTIFKTMTLLLAMSVAFVSCKNDEDPPKPTLPEKAVVVGDFTNDCDGINQIPVKLTASSVGADSIHWYIKTGDRYNRIRNAQGQLLTGFEIEIVLIRNETHVVAAGANFMGEGIKSAAHIIEITSCGAPPQATIASNRPGPSGGSTTAKDVQCTGGIVRLTAYALGATSYDWYVDGERIPGEAGEILTVQEFEATVRNFSVLGKNAAYGPGILSNELPITWTDACKPYDEILDGSCWNGTAREFFDPGNPGFTFSGTEIVRFTEENRWAEWKNPQGEVREYTFLPDVENVDNDVVQYFWVRNWMGTHVDSGRYGASQLIIYMPDYEVSNSQTGNIEIHEIYYVPDKIYLTRFFTYGEKTYVGAAIDGDNDGVYGIIWSDAAPGEGGIVLDVTEDGKFLMFPQRVTFGDGAQGNWVYSIAAMDWTEDANGNLIDEKGLGLFGAPNTIVFAICAQTRAISPTNFNYKDLKWRPRPAGVDSGMRLDRSTRLPKTNINTQKIQ